MPVQVLFLGGVEVGASCTAFQFGDSWLVVDAGVRMQGTGEQRLPDLTALDGKPVAAILITHAHADHIGALPLLHERFPEAPIYATAATIRLMKIMLADALSVMAKRATEELELPLYNAELVERTLRRLTPLPVDVRLPLPEIPDLVVSLRLAGHIAGAVSVGLEHPQGRIVVSGDISIAPQRTIDGARPPLVTDPDLLILESTYGGGQRHTPRQEEERRLAAEVAAAVKRGGHVLIPAFALGRAQEVLLILQEAQRRREIHDFPVWADGLIRQVSLAYSLIPTFLRQSVRQRIVRGQPVFFDHTIRMVGTPSQRAEIVNGQPACIIASSGMLTGGASAWFATHLAPRPEATIAITGYQDEEAPGRALQQVASGQRSTITLGQRTLGVAAKVTTYRLSGHADESELVAFAQQIRPRLVALVHGDPGARRSVAHSLHAVGIASVIPGVGQALRVTRASQGAFSPIPSPEALIALRTRQAAPDGPDTLAQVLWEELGRPVEPVPVEVSEVARIWYGVEGQPEEVRALAALLVAGSHRFHPLAALPGFFRLLPPPEVRQAAAVEVPRVQAGSLVMARVNGGMIVPFYCAVITNTRITGVAPTRHVPKVPVTLRDVIVWVGHWDIPDTATADAQQRVIDDWIVQSSTRRSHISAQVLAEALQPEASYNLDALVAALGQPPQDLSWRVHVARLVAANPHIFARTAVPQPLQDARWSIRLAPNWRALLARGQATPRPDTDAMQRIIDHQFRGVKELYRRSIDPDSGAITLLFRFPLTAERRFATQLAALRAELPVPISIGGDTDQAALHNLIHHHLGSVVRVAGTPSVFVLDRRVEVRYVGTPDPKALAAAAAAIEERSGFSVGCVPADRPASSQNPLLIAAPAETRVERDAAVATAQEVLGDLLLAVDGDKNTHTLFLRVPLPHGDARRHRERLERVAALTGWGIRLRPHSQVAAMEAAVRAVLPEGITLAAPLSIQNQKQQIVARYQGHTDPDTLARAQGAFEQAENWRLSLLPADG